MRLRVRSAGEGKPGDDLPRGLVDAKLNATTHRVTLAPAAKLRAMLERQAQGKFQNGVRDAGGQGIDWTDCT